MHAVPRGFRSSRPVIAEGRRAQRASKDERRLATGACGHPSERRRFGRSYLRMTRLRSTAPPASPRSARASDRRGCWRRDCRPRSAGRCTGLSPRSPAARACCHGISRSSLPVITKIGQVMFCATPLSDSVAAWRLRLLLRGAMAAHAERLARQLRQAVPASFPVIRPAEREAGLDALLERRGARRVIAAEADAPQADARGVEIARASRRNRPPPSRRPRSRRGWRNRIRPRPAPARRTPASRCRARDTAARRRRFLPSRSRARRT